MLDVGRRFRTLVVELALADVWLGYYLVVDLRCCDSCYEADSGEGWQLPVPLCLDGDDQWSLWVDVGIGMPQ